MSATPTTPTGPKAKHPTKWVVGVGFLILQGVSLLTATLLVGPGDPFPRAWCAGDIIPGECKVPCINVYAGNVSVSTIALVTGLILAAVSYYTDAKLFNNNSKICIGSHVLVLATVAGVVLMGLALKGPADMYNLDVYVNANDAAHCASYNDPPLGIRRPWANCHIDACWQLYKPGPDVGQAVIASLHMVSQVFFIAFWILVFFVYILRGAACMFWRHLFPEKGGGCCIKIRCTWFCKDPQYIQA